MNLLEELNKLAASAFEKAGMDPAYGKITVSNRPDLSEYQCNGAMAAAKVYHKAPIQIANEVVPYLSEIEAFQDVNAVMPGFINLNVKAAYLRDFVATQAEKERFGAECPEKKKIVVDYGGPNVAKPLHIGHLRSAIIGESIKRILSFMGHETIGDPHLGDWGLQIGLIIERLKELYPDLPYFDASFTGEYPTEAPFTISELETIYPEASKKSKEDPEFFNRAHENTVLLQNGHPGYRAIWQHIIHVSVTDLKKNYDKLNVHFEMWKSESDAQPYIPDMIERFKKDGIAYLSDGALVVDVAEETDKHEIPPCIVVKSDGGSLYATTDLATVIMRMEDLNPDGMIYLADKRQDLHYTQFFRVSRKAGIVKPDTLLKFIGFGTMNGKDGKPFKTRDGGVMRLETLISDVNNAVREKMKERYEDGEVDEETAAKVALAAIKYGDLSNQATKDYNFDIDRFCSFEGNTGPYILYTIVRIKSILRKAGLYTDGAITLDTLKNASADFKGLTVDTPELKALYKSITGFPPCMEAAMNELAPHKVCVYLYELCDAFNGFYHETPILKEENETLRAQYLSLITFVLRILLSGIDVLGFEAPEKM